MNGYGVNWVEGCQGGEDFAVVQTTAGRYAVYARGAVLLRTVWVAPDYPLTAPNSPFLSDLVRQIDQYWQNDRTRFEVNLLTQGTEFQRRVWRALLTIPFGETLTYADLAKKLATGARAVGSACRYNPFPVIIPCHRVVSVKGMGGYAGQLKGEMRNIKQKLLAHEWLSITSG